MTSIADDAFLNCDNVTIHADEGSVAEKLHRSWQSRKSESSGNGSADGDTGGRRNFGFTGNNTSLPPLNADPCTDTGARKCDRQYLCRRKSCDGYDAA